MKIPAKNLVAARLELHRAAQIAADVGRTLCPAQPDDSHTNLRFLPSRRALAGPFTPGKRSVRALLEASPLRISVEFKNSGKVAVLPLIGLRSDEAWLWMDDVIGKPLSRFRFEIPDGPGGTTPFGGAPRKHFEELAWWYAHAHSLLSQTRRGLTNPSSVRCWPHHFDVAFLLPIPRGRGKTKGSIGVGLSPGDENYAEPYWYVTPWPHADQPDLPKLSGGHWHRRDWLGAVLTGGSQVRASRTFLKSAIAACRQVIRSAP